MINTETKIVNGKVQWWSPASGLHEQELLVDPEKVRAFCAKQPQGYRGIHDYYNHGNLIEGTLILFDKNEDNVQQLNSFAHSKELLPEVWEEIKL